MIKKFLLICLLSLTMLTIFGCDDSQPNQNTVTITFVTEVEGLTVSPISGEPGKNIPQPDVPARTGYRFTGWFDEAGEYYRLTRFPEVSITLYARWELLSSQSVYYINFLTNSSEYIEPIALQAGQPIPSLPIPNYFITGDLISSFDQWEYQGEQFDIDLMPSVDLVLNATWHTGNQAIYFNTSTEQAIQPIVANPGEEIEPPKDAPTKTDFVFMGWQKSGKPYIFDVMPAETITVDATWLDTTTNVNNAASNLPKVFVNIQNTQALTSVTKETYVNTSITITNTSESDELNAVSAEFKGRGNGSWTNSGPKRGYRIKFFHKQAVFGESKSKHWVLLAGANFYDPTLLKTKLAFDLTNDVFTNIDYASSANLVELYVNGAYRGVYILAEHLRVDDDRVNIDSAYGVDDTGYFVEYDSYISNEGIRDLDYFMISGYRYGFGIKSPDPADYLEEGITELRYKQQVTYIKNYMTETMTAALNAPTSAQAYETFKEKADINSFIDMYILHELFKNSDTGWSSFYMYKKPNGKLFAGPPWDFDASAGKNRGNQTYSGIYVSGSVEYESNHTSSELYIALMKVTEFKEAVKSRWQLLSPTIKTFVNSRISQTFLDDHSESLGKNYYFWSLNANTEGLIAEMDSTYLNYSSLTAASTGWISHTNNLKSWLLNRVDWLDDEWQI